MKIRKTDKLGTIHELAVQLANIAELDKINPVSTKEKNSYVKLLEKYKVFKSNLTLKEKKDIVAKLKLMNFNENEIEEQQNILRAINSYNRIVDKKKREIEIEIRSGKNVKKNDLIYKGIDKVELNIPRNIRGTLKIYEKAVKLKKYSTVSTKNRINYYSGLNYRFMIKDGFSRPYYMDYDKIQKIRREGNIVTFLLNNYEESVKVAYEKDRLLLEKSDRKRWLAKQRVYNKILKVIEHNRNISENKKYNKKLLTRDKNGKIVKDNSEYPVLMNIVDELIDLYIP